ncbi:MAG: nucleotidyltransferase [Hydrococcus sp. RU_2_2]|nr:nucleotidyltransferase [Hydrococcus sp. RU_2_2]
MTEIDKYSSEIQRICDKYRVKTLYAFGSVLTDKYSDSSDLDFLVDFDPIDLTQYADNYFNLKFSLEAVLKRKIDLIEERAVKNPYFLQVVNSQRKLVYGH